LQGLRLGEGTANDDGAEFAAEALVDLPQKAAAETQPRTAFRKSFVDGNERVENLSFSRG